MDYFKNLKNKITPQKTQPTHAEQLAKFRKSWNYIEVSGGDSISIDEQKKKKTDFFQ